MGIFAVGGLAVGMFSLGGLSIASHIAMGGYASGHIAIGDTVKGAYTFITQDNNFNDIKGEEVRKLIQQEYPHLWKPIVQGIISIFK